MIRETLTSVERLRILTGPMFSDKTETLIHMAKAIPEELRACYRPERDTRDENGFFVSHRGTRIPCQWAKNDLSDVVLKMSAKCAQCGELATRTFRKVWSEELILVGTDDKYESRCIRCFLEC